ERTAAVLASTGLTDRRKDRAKGYSGGMQRRLNLACALVHDPQILFLDEPTAGVDPVSRREFWENIHQLSAQGTTVVVTTHYMDEAERCHRLAFIFRGRVLQIGRPDEIVASRGLSVAELVVDDATVAAANELFAGAPEVDEYAHYGNVIRVATRGVDALAWSTAALAAAGIPLHSSRSTRATVEDAFVSMVREDRS
ncbi:MAG: ABC transporter ATP-binding protein, partial [Myxococcales bacterium]|nr:ABC transporter ATP-binding protein [Myxococcales bacterium]